MPVMFWPLNNVRDRFRLHDGRLAHMLTS